MLWKLIVGLVSGLLLAVMALQPAQGTATDRRSSEA
jgi:hypothetical protein